MIEEKVRMYLDGISGYHAFMEVPEDVTEKSFIVVQKTGGGENDGITPAIFAVQSYGGSLYEAALLNDAVKKKMKDFARVENIFSCRCNTDYNFTDTKTKRYRYQAVFQISYMED